ncbi:hypothetical protein F2Z80_23275 [Vibrio fortis]|jgi:hypothetical protein|uniref:Uncharacterized protein n=1 Tax=Vibrio fortis TaxID=212667 RepID=A0A5N3RZL5_9VIBR|nr:hypothetical protein [Vibrio fortis]KAB0300046.1 hypothetical protein F2Z80_23275 [Vibrio fortis]
MEKLRLVLYVVIVLITVGCTTYSNNHYSLMAEPSNQLELQSQIHTIKTAFEPVLEVYGLEDAISEKTPDNVLLYYKSKGDSALRVGIRLSESSVIFDTFQYRSGSGNSPQYESLLTELIILLETMDGIELVEVDGPAI